ncbi:unnamed protein product, partial [marine sediment metagenome]
SEGISWAEATNGTLYLSSNPFGFYNITTIPSFALISDLVSYVGNWSADKNDYYTKTNIDDFSLSHWTDDLGDRGYTHLTNFTDNILWTSGFNASFDARDSDTIYSVGGSLLDLTDTTFSINVGTLTTEKGCKFVTGTGIVCDQDYLTSYTETDPLWTGNKTNVAFKNEANLFTANQNMTDNSIVGLYYLNFTDGGYIYDNGTSLILGHT